MLLGGSCTDSVMDRINRNESNPPASAVSAKFQLTDAIVSTVFSTVGGNMAWFASSYTEQMFGAGNNLLMYAELRDPSATAAASTFNNEWRNTYANLQNLKQMRQKCSPGGINAGQTDLLGMAEVLWCVEWHALATLFGDVPYSEALDSHNKTPRLDAQADIYADLLRITDDAVAHLEDAVGRNLNTAGAQDFLYQGDAQKWLALAHAVKARMLLDGSVRHPDALAEAGNEAQAALDAGFAGAWLRVFNGLGVDNPWAAFQRSRKYLGANTTLAAMLDDDPRLGVYACDTFGTGITSAPAGDATLAITTQEVGAPAWLLNLGAPAALLSLSELYFIKAEVKARTGADATADFQSGIEASYSEWAEACGIQAIPIAVTTRSATLGDIMRQKYIAMAVAGVLTTYNDLRRCRALGEEHVKLNNPNNTLDGRNRWPLRLPYGSSDVTANPNVAAAFGEGNAAGMYIFSNPVWLFAHD